MSKFKEIGESILLGIMIVALIAVSFYIEVLWTNFKVWIYN
jgi:hypothetical protein